MISCRFEVVVFIASISADTLSFLGEDLTDLLDLPIEEHFPSTARNLNSDLRTTGFVTSGVNHFLLEDLQHDGISSLHRDQHGIRANGISAKMVVRAAVKQRPAVFAASYVKASPTQPALDEPGQKIFGIERTGRPSPQISFGAS